MNDFFRALFKVTTKQTLKHIEKETNKRIAEGETKPKAIGKALGKTMLDGICIIVVLGVIFIALLSAMTS